MNNLEKRMKTKVWLLLLVVLLATTGSTCINDGFLVAVNLPIQACFAITPGPTLNWTPTDPGQPVVVKLGDQIDASYLDNIKNVRYYDIKVSVKGTYAGSVSGIAYINNTPLLTYSGAWSDFAAGQSLLGSSTHITPQSGGITTLLASLNLLKTNPATTVALSSSGSLAGQTPVPAGLSVCVEILAQVDAEVK
jgi:hypothetical protein